MDYPVLYHNNIDAEPDQSSVSMIDLLWENSSLSGFHGNNISLCPPQQCSCLYRTCCRTATFTNKTLPNSDCEVCYSLSQYQHVTYGQYRRGKLAATISLSAREHATKDTSQTFCFPQRSYSTSKMYVCPWSMSCGHTTYPNSPAVNINTTSPLSHLSCPPPSNTDLPSPSPHQYPLYHLHNPQTPEEDHCYPNTSPLSIYDSNCSLDSSSINSPAVSPPQLSTSQALAPISCFKSNVQERLGEEVVGEDCTELQKDGSTSPRVGECTRSMDYCIIAMCTPYTGSTFPPKAFNPNSTLTIP